MTGDGCLQEGVGQEGEYEWAWHRAGVESKRLPSRSSPEARGSRLGCR
jgi:hypothetical protein